MANVTTQAVYRSSYGTLNDGEEGEIAINSAHQLVVAGTGAGGSTTVVQPTASLLNAQVVGNVASAAADSGNPVKVGLKVNVTSPTFTDGNRADLQGDINGYLKNREQYAPTAEDNTNGVYAGAVKPLATSTYSWTLFQNLAANATLNIKATPGTVKSIYCVNNNAAARYIGLYNSATTASGTPTLNFMVPPAVGGVPGVVNIDGQTLGENGFFFSTGIAFGFSTSSSTYSAGSAGDMLILQVMRA